MARDSAAPTETTPTTGGPTSRTGAGAVVTEGPPVDVTPGPPRQPAPPPTTGAPPSLQAGRQLGATGSATRSLIVLAGVALLLGAVAVAYGEPAVGNGVVGEPSPVRRGRRVRRTIPGWESGVPLAPDRRDRVRRRAGRRRRRQARLSFPAGGPGA
jgi:hypothetical protein